MKFLFLIFFFCLILISFSSNAERSTTRDISHLITKEAFLEYKDVAEFIDDAPQVTITVKASEEEIKEFGQNFVKSLTGSDCDRDGKMDDNATCNAVFFKLWMKYAR